MDQKVMDRRRDARDREVEKALYARREKIYPREVHGLFAYLRITAVVVLLGIFYGLPWLDWNGQQSVLLDMPNRKFHLFGLTLWPQDFLYLAFLLIIAAFSLFFFTALAGRLWCGYACPQTVWTEVFLWMEQWVEGDRNKRMKLDREPMSWHKFRIKATKQFLWLTFSAFTGFTFVSYFSPQDELFQRLMSLQLGPWESFWMFFYGLATYGNAGYLREQVCKYMCPYARFQSAMFDKDTLIISYDAKRGEPRGPRKRSANPRELGLGDCIDCTMCVQVCPTGIDIRDGLQYECIGCAACIDICDEVMEKMGYPKGLIRYTTQNAIEGKQTHLIRPRMIVYGLLLLGMMVALGYAVATRNPIGLDVLRDRNSLFREVGAGLIENVYTLKVMNMDDRPHEYRVTAEGLPELQVLTDRPTFTVRSGEVVEVPVRLRVPEDALGSRRADVTFILQSVDAPELQTSEESRFLGPMP